MTELGDRTLILIVIATGLAGVFGWIAAIVHGQMDGPVEWLIRGGLFLLYVVILVGFYRFLRSGDPDNTSTSTT